MRQPKGAFGQGGFALLGLVGLLVAGTLFLAVHFFSPEAVSARRQQVTEAALVQAREALMGYVMRHRELNPDSGGELVEVYGFLPLPDLGNLRNNNIDPKCKDAFNIPLEGCDAANFGGNAPNITVIGRLPWRTLGLPALRDGHGECLWYAVSGSHQRIHQLSPMNADTLSQLDVVIANGGSSLVSLTNQILYPSSSKHDKPVAIIFSAGPPLAGQNRGNSVGDDVTECGGNYDVANYLDPGTAATLGGVSNYFPAATNDATGDTSTTDKSLSPQGAIQRRASDGTLWPHNCPAGSNCVLAANDFGMTVTPDELFGALRKSGNFRTDINSMLDRMVGCLRDQVASGGSLVAGRIPGLDTDACYGKDQTPKNYYPNYKELVFVATPPSPTVTEDGVPMPPPACAGVLLFANQRTSTQRRASATDKTDISQYLEGVNSALTTGGTSFSGQSQFSRVSPSQSIGQDIVRCIPAGASFTSVESTQLTTQGFGQLTTYDAATRTLTLGQVGAESDLGADASALFGCAWTPETRATGNGFRSYYNFQITNSGDGYVFAAADGDRNSIGACGAARQHLGYSGNNGYTATIAHPKLGIEFDTRRNYKDASASGFTDPIGFNPAYLGSTPATDSYLINGRADPGYVGGHLGIVYWGREASIETNLACTVTTPCTAPQFCNATTNTCHLKAEEDDNVHGRTTLPPATRPPPLNEAAPVTPPSPPPYPPKAVDKLDPSLSQVPTGLIHVRVEMERTAYAGRDDNSRLVRAVSTSNLPLSGLTTIDSVALAEGDTVLVVAQADAKANGVFLASAGAWIRATSADEGADLPPGTSWFVQKGAVYRGSLWRLQNVDMPIVGVSPLDIQRVRDPVKTVATSNLALSGLQTVNGVLLAAGDRILLTGQTDPKQNGVYAASAAGWIRAAPENGTAGMKAGAMWFVSSGGLGGTYWRLGSDVTPGTSNITISLQTANDIYTAVLTTKIWKPSSDETDRIALMKDTTRSMNLLDPVVRHAQCLVGNTCPATNPPRQTCAGPDPVDGFNYCYTGHRPKLYDSKKVYDIRTTTSCASNTSCTGSQQFCGIDNMCYQPAFRTTRLGFTNSQSTSDQVILIRDFFTTWLP